MVYNYILLFSNLLILTCYKNCRCYNNLLQSSTTAIKQVTMKMSFSVNELFKVISN